MRDVNEIVDALPNKGRVFHSGYEIPRANAYVHVDHEGRLCVYPNRGGVLFVSLHDVDGDIAPFCD